MNINKAIESYQNNAQSFNQRFSAISSKVEQNFTKPQERFIDVLESSFANVNELQSKKNQAIEDFASGKNDNVQDLMIAMQRASTAVQLTSAVRNKVIEIYQQISQIPL